MKKITLVITFVYMGLSIYANPVTKQLQSILDSGADLVLEKGKTYEIDTTLVLKTKGQSIYTENAENIKDYAVIKCVDPELITVLSAEGIPNITIKNLCFNGNRDNLRPATGKVPMQPFISLGKESGDDQTIKNCIVLNARCAGGWAAIHVHENAFRTTIQNNIIFGSGVDVLGNGRSALEQAFGWGDGISVAARNSLIKNNLIIDVADEGVMIQGAPGTKAYDNVVVALSREVLGGVALIDPAAYCLLNKEENTYDYRGVEVKNNLVHALGARVHIGYPCGMDVWNFNDKERIIVGAEVTNNVMTGKIGGYGYAVGGVKNFKVTNNTSTAIYEERGDGLPNNPPDEPAAFIYAPAKTFDTELQEEFIPAKKHIIHLMRNFRQPVNEAGYRILDKYGTIEAEAIVSAAYIEMLGRSPKKKEMAHWTNWLHETNSNADAIRTALMLSSEFKKENGSWRPTQLQECRVKLFMNQLYIAFDEFENNSWPKANQLHNILFSQYQKQFKLQEQ